MDAKLENLLAAYCTLEARYEDLVRRVRLAVDHAITIESKEYPILHPSWMIPVARYYEVVPEAKEVPREP